MVISIVAGPKFIDFLRRHEFGQHIREEGPSGHVIKQGTPTMGGLLIMASMFIPFLVFSQRTIEALTVFFVTLACAAIGFVDDWRKLTNRRSLGISGRWKMAFLVLITIFVGLVAERQGLGTDIYVPLIDVNVELSYALVRAPLPHDRRRRQRREPDRRPGRPGRGHRHDLALHLHGDGRRGVDRRAAGRPAASPPSSTSPSSARASSVPRSGSSGTTRTPPRSSWATRARSASAARSARSR